MRLTTRPEDLDGCDAVTNAGVVEKHRVERLEERERTEGPSGNIAHMGHTPATLVRPIKATKTQSTPSRCMPSGVGFPGARSVGSIRN